MFVKSWSCSLSKYLVSSGLSFAPFSLLVNDHFHMCSWPNPYSTNKYSFGYCAALRLTVQLYCSLFYMLKLLMFSQNKVFNLIKFKSDSISFKPCFHDKKKSKLTRNISKQNNISSNPISEYKSIHLYYLKSPIALSQGGWHTAGLGSVQPCVQSCDIVVIWGRSLYLDCAWTGNWGQGKLMVDLLKASTGSSLLKTRPSKGQQPRDMSPETSNIPVCACLYLHTQVGVPVTKNICTDIYSTLFCI